MVGELFSGFQAMDSVGSGTLAAAVVPCLLCWKLDSAKLFDLLEGTELFFLTKL